MLVEVVRIQRQVAVVEVLPVVEAQRQAALAALEFGQVVAEQQAAVVVIHRSHSGNLHRIVVEKEANIPQVPVNVENKRVQHEHPAHKVLAAVLFSEFQECSWIPAIGNR